LVFAVFLGDHNISKNFYLLEINGQGLKLVFYNLLQG